MEIKNPTDMIVEDNNATVNVTSTCENYPFSWVALQEDSKYKSIINAINQLLNMYHPDDGISAYKNVLKTLLVLSENFDSDTQQRIISIIPLPKGASDVAIKNIICQTTDLVRSTNSMTAYQNIVPENNFNAEVFDERSEMHLNPNILVNTSSQNFELAPSVPEVFRGFPPNEISMIHSHVKNVNCVYNTLDNSIPCVEACINIKQNFSSNINEEEESLKLRSNLEWFHAPHLLYKTNSYQGTAYCYQAFCKLSDDKHFQLPNDKLNNYNHCNTANVPRTLYQDNAYFKRRLHRSGVMLNKQDQTGISNSEATHSKCLIKSETDRKASYNGNMEEDFKKCDNNVCKNKVAGTEVYKHFAQELRNEQILQQDIYKMDVVCYDEKEGRAVINPKMPKENNFMMDNFVVRKELKTSLYSFLKRAEQEILIEVPMLPQIKSLRVGPPTAKRWSFVTEKSLKDNNELDSPLNTKNISKRVNTTESTNKCAEKKPLRSFHIYPKSAQLRNLNPVLSKAQATECEKRDNVEHLRYRSTAKQTRQNNMNSLQQSASITELATFKKQYYDTLLNIRKAKAAVANSMALSSVETSTKYDPYYSGHSYQQQLLQQHDQLTVNPQFAMHTVTQSGLSNMYNTPYAWMKYNDWSHPRAKQLRFSQEFPLQLSRNKE